MSLVMDLSVVSKLWLFTHDAVTSPLHGSCVSMTVGQGSRSAIPGLRSVCIKTEIIGHQPGVEVHACYPSAQEVEVRW